MASSCNVARTGVLPGRTGEVGGADHAAPLAARGGVEDRAGREPRRVAAGQPGERGRHARRESQHEPALEPATGHVLLHASALAAGARQPVGAELRVPELARCVPGAAPQDAVEHSARADAGADEHDDRAPRSRRGAESKLPPGRGADVVVDPDRQPDRVRHRGAQRDVLPAEVRGEYDGLGLGMDLAGAGDANGLGTPAPGGQLGHETRDRGKDLSGAALGFGKGLDVGEDATIGANQARPNARAPEVDADRWRDDYAFFSSSFFAAAVESSFVASVTPFLNSFTLEPSERASSVSRFAPNRISTMTMISSSAWYPKPNM